MNGWPDVVIEYLVARPPLSHVMLALLVMSAVMLALFPFRVRNGHWIAAALASGFYWGREKRDHEASLQLPMEEAWQKGWIPLEWSSKGQADFFWPRLACLAAALLVELRLGK